MPSGREDSGDLFDYDLNAFADAFGVERPDPHVHDLAWTLSPMDDGTSSCECECCPRCAVTPSKQNHQKRSPTSAAMGWNVALHGTCHDLTGREVYTILAWSAERWATPPLSLFHRPHEIHGHLYAPPRNPHEIHHSRLFGLEALVADEMRRLDLKTSRRKNGRVHCDGGLGGHPRLNINLLRPRVLVELASFPARDFEALFQGVAAIPGRTSSPGTGSSP